MIGAPKKGSVDAKVHMAKLRAKRLKSTSLQKPTGEGGEYLREMVEDKWNIADFENAVRTFIENEWHLGALERAWGYYLLHNKPAPMKPAAKRSARSSSSSSSSSSSRSPLEQVRDRLGQELRCDFCYRGFSPRVLGQRFCCVNCRNKWHYHKSRGNFK